MLSTADKKKWTRPPISVYFEANIITVVTHHSLAAQVPFACSGLTVKFLKLVESKLKSACVMW